MFNSSVQDVCTPSNLFDVNAVSFYIHIWCLVGAGCYDLNWVFENYIQYEYIVHMGYAKYEAKQPVFYMNYANSLIVARQIVGWILRHCNDIWRSHKYSNWGSCYFQLCHVSVFPTQINYYYYTNTIQNLGVCIQPCSNSKKRNGMSIKFGIY